MELWTVIHNEAYMYAQYIHAYQALCGKAYDTYSNVIFYFHLIRTRQSGTRVQKARRGMSMIISSIVVCKVCGNV